jgi:hypothetical protein
MVKSTGPAIACIIVALSLASSSIAQETPEDPAPADTLAAENITQEDLLEVQASVHGRRGRRLFKNAYWAAGLTGDMKKVYGSHGYPSSRYREQKAGVLLEKWTYLEEGKQFTFRDSRLTRTREFNPGSALGIYID